MARKSRYMGYKNAARTMRNAPEVPKRGTAHESIRQRLMRLARKKQVDNQLSFDDYQLKQVDVRLKLMDGPSYYSQTPLQNPADAAMVMRDVLKELDR